MRQLNEMFHIDGERLVKSSNGESVPEDEPVFILRGRDALSCWTLARYIEACKGNGVPTDRLDALRAVKECFDFYAREKGVKVPGSTHGR